MRKIVDSTFCDESVSRPLDLVRPHHSTDPRDKVYGLHGIFDSLVIECLPVVDYTKSA